MGTTTIENSLPYEVRGPGAENERLSGWLWSKPRLKTSAIYAESSVNSFLYESDGTRGIG